MTHRLPSVPLRDVLTGILLACTIATVVHFARGLPAAQDLENRLFTRFCRALDARHFGDGVAVVEIDDQTYASFDIKSPVPRDRLASVIATLCESAHPRAIGLDILLDRPSPAGHSLEDDALEDALEEAHCEGIPVVLACDPLPGDGEPPVFPLPRFARWAETGHVDVTVGADGVARSAPWVETAMGAEYDSLAARLAALSASPDARRQESWVRERLRARGRHADAIYYVPDARFLSLPMNSLAQNEAGLSRLLGGKVVLIGATAQVADDFHRAPIALPRFGDRVPGIYVQAYMAATLLAPGIRSPGPAADWLLSALSGAALLAVLYRQRTGVAFALTGIGVVALSLGALALFAYGEWAVDLTPTLLAMFLCAWVWWAIRGIAVRRHFESFLTRPVHRGIRSSGNLTDLRPATGPASVLICDLIGYSAACRDVSPEQALSMVNYYLSPIAAIVAQRGGLLDKFTGDGCLVFFGAPLAHEADLPLAASVWHAAQTAVQICEQQRCLALDAPGAGLPALTMSFGLHCGPLTAGVIGNGKRSQFTVIGDTVNEACRVESIGHLDSTTPPLSTRILVSEAAAALLMDRAEFQDIQYPAIPKYSGRVFELCRLRMSLERRPADQEGSRP